MAKKLTTTLNVVCPECHKPWRIEETPRTSWCLSCAPSPLTVREGK